MREYGLTTMVMELVREISTTDGKELARDTSGTRSVTCPFYTFVSYFVFKDRSLSIIL